MFLAGVGGFVVVETATARPLRLVVIAFGALTAVLSAVCTAVLLQRFILSKPPEADSPEEAAAASLDQVDGAASAFNAIVLSTFATVNFCGACSLWNQAARPSSPPHAIYEVAHVWLRIGCALCGGAPFCFFTYSLIVRGSSCPRNRRWQPPLRWPSTLRKTVLRGSRLSSKSATRSWRRGRTRKWRM